MYGYGSDGHRKEKNNDEGTVSTLSGVVVFTLLQGYAAVDKMFGDLSF